ncbi:hypothetical protein HRE53_17215 [Acaryochloris sp. 'Moss Beach']|nr:hypothetical protein [Acaryochloris sp. 'Moss Beach']UJB68289.1 hypothetical protein HRE53_17215 [Acaryochloris sp. 'Moss Beach']
MKSFLVVIFSRGGADQLKHSSPHTLLPLIRTDLPETAIEPYTHSILGK